MVTFISTHPLVSSRGRLEQGFPPLVGGSHVLVLLDLIPLHSQSDHSVKIPFEHLSVSSNGSSGQGLPLNLGEIHSLF